MWSNCFVEAIEFRIRYGYNVFLVKPIEKDGMPHFCWWDVEDKCYKHYTYRGKKKLRWYKFLWFDGVVDIFPYKRLKNVKLIKVM